MDHSSRNQIKDSAVDSVFSDDTQAAITAVRAALDAGVTPGELIRETDRRVGNGQTARRRTAADYEVIQTAAAIAHIADLPDPAAQRRLARCAGFWSAATTQRTQTARQKHATRRTRRAAYLHRVRHALHLAA